MPVSCTVYEIDENIDASVLEDELGDTETTRPLAQADSNIELLTDFDDVEKDGSAVDAEMRYDIGRRISARDDESSWVGEMKSRDIRFNEGLFGGCLMIFGSQGRGAVLGRCIDTINEVFDLDTEPDDYTRKSISSGDITRVVSNDSIQMEEGWWDDIDANMSSASAQGDLDHSDKAEGIIDDGIPVWITFVSRDYSEKLGLSRKNDTVVFYGDWEISDMENYIEDIVFT